MRSLVNPSSAYPTSSLRCCRVSERSCNAGVSNRLCAVNISQTCMLGIIVSDAAICWSWEKMTVVVEGCVRPGYQWRGWIGTGENWTRDLLIGNPEEGKLQHLQSSPLKTKQLHSESSPGRKDCEMLTVQSLSLSHTSHLWTTTWQQYSFMRIIRHNDFLTGDGVCLTLLE